jgi:tetratricopeptide (TPR) repeat protein
MNRSWLVGAIALLSIAIGGGEAVGCTLNFVDLPITMSDLRATLAVKINGAPATLAIDSGAFYSFISAPSAAALHLPLRAAPPGMDVIRGINGDAEIYLTTVKQLTVGSAVLPNLDFTVGGGAIGRDVAGLIGQNILARGDVEYDLGHGVMRLVRPIGCPTTMLAYWDKTEPYSVLDIGAIDGTSDTTVSSAVVNGVTMRVLFDTGSPTSFLTLKAAKRAGFDIHGPGVVAAGETTGLGRGRLATWIAPVKSFKIGDEEIHNTHLRIGDAPLFDRDMLIGADFFLSHHIYVANSQRKLYFTYNGGPVFNLTLEGAAPAQPAPAAVSDETPTDAAGFGRRGAAYLARGDDAAAIADLTRAVEMAPLDATFRFHRAQAYFGAGKVELASGDLDKAIELAPADPPALMLRARLRLANHDKARALGDLDAAARAATRQADARLELGELYAQADALGQAIEQYDLWLANHPQDADRVAVLNSRCWAKALAGQDLPGAVKDCDAALSMSPRSAAILDSRGLARLRLRDFERSIQDYDAALKIDPKIAWSLYGRGLAKLRTGRTADGKADIAAALALQPSLAEKAKVHGLEP